MTSEARASWIFGSLLAVFLLGVFVLGPQSLPSYKQQILAYICASLAAFFAVFFTGSLLIKAQLPLPGKWSVQGGAAFALFLVVLFWWRSPASPIAPTTPPNSANSGGVGSNSSGGTGPLAGSWKGILGGVNLPLTLHIDGRDSNMTATIDDPDQGAVRIPVDSITRTGNTLSFEVSALGSYPPLSFVGTVGPGGIQGTAHQGSLNFGLAFTRDQ
jgi:hypothetical protein